MIFINCFNIKHFNAIFIVSVNYLIFTVNLNNGQEQSPATFEQPFASILYTAVLSTKAALPCDILPPTGDDSVVLILWYKDDELAPIFTLDARRGHLDHARVKTSQTLEGRTYFNVHHRPAFLQIDPIQLSDAGDYRCRVDFKKARTVNTVIALKVIVPPQEPHIFDLYGKELKGLVGPYNEGDELKLICTIKGGKPRPSLSWWRDYAIIDDTFEYDDKDVTTNQLTISPLSRHHLLSILMCQAINNNVTHPVSRQITLDLNLKPTEVRITQLTPILVADGEALFECNTFGSRPMATLHWQFQGKRYDTRSHGEQQTSTTLTLTIERDHRGAKLSCVSENSKIPNSAITDQLKLDVHYAPQLSLELGTHTITLDSIQEGIDIYFDCHIDANPRPTAPIAWIFNGDVLHPQQGVIESNQSLVLQRVSRGQSGNYQCQASNQQGTALSNPINLTIKYAPVCSHRQKLIFGVSLHETLHMDCDVDANPGQVSFQWKFETFTNLNTFSQINDSSSVLTYTPHAPQELGIIECTAKNTIGIQQIPCRYELVPVSAPSFPFNCVLGNYSDTTVTINCLGEKIDTNSTTKKSSPKINIKEPLKEEILHVWPLTSYHCHVYHEDSFDTIIANVTIDATKRKLLSATASFQFFINNLPPASELTLKMFASNSKGVSITHSLHARTLRAAERLIDEDNGIALGHNFTLPRFRGKYLVIALLIGLAVVTFIVILLGIIAVFRVRYSAASVQLSPEEPIDPDADLPAAETMIERRLNHVPNYDDDDCASDETLIKGQSCCDKFECNGKMMVNLNKSGAREAPDIIPVPYFTGNCPDDDEENGHSSKRDENILYAYKNDEILNQSIANGSNDHQNMPLHELPKNYPKKLRVNLVDGDTGHYDMGL